MKIGDYIMRLTGVTQYSPIFGRGGQGALFSVNVLDVPSSGTLGITVEHKNSEDTSWTSAVTFTGITSTGVKTATASGLREQLRFAYAITGGGGPQVYDAFYIDILAPVWTP